MSDRITRKDVKDWVSTWNHYHPEFPMTTTFSQDYEAIGHLGEHGSIDVIASGTTPREAWEKFYAWKAGFAFYERMVEEGKIGVKNRQ